MQYQAKDVPQPTRRYSLLSLMYGHQYPELLDESAEVSKNELADHIEDLCDCV